MLVVNINTKSTLVLNQFQYQFINSLLISISAIRKLSVFLTNLTTFSFTNLPLAIDREDLVNIQELYIEDSSGSENLVLKLLKLCKRCSNLKKFIVDTSCCYLNFFLRSTLPLLTQLEELNLSSIKHNTYEMIRANSVNLKKLAVPLRYLNEAQTFFNETLIVEPYFRPFNPVIIQK